MRGKKRKILDMQAGHLNKKVQQELQAQENMIRQRPGAFDKVPRKRLADIEAEREWRRIVPELKRMDLIGNLDLSNVIGYCNAYAKYAKASKLLEEDPLVIKLYNDDGNLMAVKPNPLIDVQIKYATEMRKFEELCGLTISSRLKWASTKTKQQEDKIESEFGAI